MDGTELAALELCRAGNFENPAMEQALSQILLAEVGRGERPPLLRLCTTRPLVSFGSEDLRSPHLAAAAAVARARGHVPTARHSGGQAVVFGPTILLFAVITRLDRSWTPQDRFSAVATRIVTALASLGLDAEVGRLPGEYCAGDHSIHVNGRKVVGMAQRITTGAAACTEGMVVVSDAAEVRATLEAVYAALEREWDPETVGDLGAGPDIERTLTAVDSAFGTRGEAVVDSSTLAAVHDRAAHVAIPAATSLDID